VSPVFRHGRLRLYLLKLLDESPRHGYEVIRLLQDRFMGVYAPSPGTIYPRLARLEEDGLVTHEEVDGKKVYSITDKGREEIRSRLGDLADLEDELTESLRDVAREISEDVRDTVRTIREELASAAREFRADSGRTGRSRSDGAESTDGPDTGDDSYRSDGAGTADERDSATGSDQGEHASDEARRIRDEARRSRDQMRARFRAQGRSHGDWAAWAGRADWSPWSSWADWSGFRDEAGEDAGGRRPGQARDSAPGSSGRSRRAGPNPFGDLERMAMQFATELRAAAKQTGNLGERSLNDLRDILTDTLARVRTEVFADSGHGAKAAGSGDAGTDQPGNDATAAGGSADAAGQPEAD